MNVILPNSTKGTGDYFRIAKIAEYHMIIRNLTCTMQESHYHLHLLAVLLGACQVPCQVLLQVPIRDWAIDKQLKISEKVDLPEGSA
jgi:hypothetical protein